MYRVSKEGFSFILNEIKDEFPVSRNKNCVTPVQKLAATLRFLAEGSYQRGVGQDLFVGVAQQTVSKILSETLDILEKKLCKTWISFNFSEDEKNEIKRYFYDKAGIPGVVGCVDGTHIRIIKPSSLEHFYYNRKGYHSINAMLVSKVFICYFKYIILN